MSETLFTSVSFAFGNSGSMHPPEPSKLNDWRCGTMKSGASVAQPAYDCAS